ncbi:MAG: hypothetical protein LBE91_14085, partial [Tannerella sp.]|nr:hypothetical protein [Tannerella sp.]
MKKRLLLTVYFLTVAVVCFAQGAVSRDSVQTMNNNEKKPVIPSGRTILKDMRANNPEMYLQYQSAKKRQRTGIIMTGAGGGLLVIGAIFSFMPDADEGTITMGPYVIETDGNNSGLRKAGTALMITGTA